jgi:hypothetical protein
MGGVIVEELLIECSLVIKYMIATPGNRNAAYLQPGLHPVSVTVTQSDGDRRYGHEISLLVAEH